MPRDELVREIRPGAARPRALAVAPLEVEARQPRARALRRREIELEHRLARAAERRGAARRPLPARADPVLLDGQVVAAGEELRAEFQRIRILGRGREPALEQGAERDAADVALQLRGQAQAGGAEARHQPRVAERGGGQRRLGHGRRAAPGAVLEEVERLGLERDEHGARGGAAIGRHEPQLQPIAGGG